MSRAFALIAFLVACKYPDPGVDDGGMSSEEGLGEDRAYVVAHRSLDGASTKIVILPTLDVFGEVSLANARTFGANTQVFMAGGRVFVATDRSIKRYVVEGSTLVADGGTIDFVTTAVTRFTGVFAVFDDTTAWYFDTEQRQAFALDLETMMSSTAIFFSSLDENAINAKPVPTGAYRVGDVVYMPFFYVKAGDPTFVESETYVAQFSYSNKSLSTTTSASCLRRGMCTHLYPFAKLADDTQIFLGDSGSLSVLGTPTTPEPNCLRRIVTTDPNNMDFGFTIVTNDLTSPYIGASHPVHYGDLVVTWTREDTPITTQAEWDTLTRWVPQVTNLADLQTEEVANLTQLENPIVSIGAPGKTFFVAGEPTFLVPKAVQGDGTELLNGSGTTIATFPGTVTWLERVR